MWKWGCWNEALHFDTKQKTASKFKKDFDKGWILIETIHGHKCGDKRCEYCNHLLLSKHYIFKQVNYKFTLKSPTSCESSHPIYGYVHMGMISYRYRTGLIFGTETLIVHTGAVRYRTSFGTCSHGYAIVLFRSISHQNKQKKIWYLNKFLILPNKE